MPEKYIEQGIWIAAYVILGSILGLAMGELVLDEISTSGMNSMAQYIERLAFTYLFGLGAGVYAIKRFKLLENGAGIRWSRILGVAILVLCSVALALYALTEV